MPEYVDAFPLLWKRNNLLRDEQTQKIRADSENTEDSTVYLNVRALEKKAIP